MTHIGSLLLDAATLMVTGMAVVFLFLTLLVYLVQFMSRVIPQEVPELLQRPRKVKKFNQSLIPLAHKSWRQSLRLCISTAVRQRNSSLDYKD